MTRRIPGRPEVSLGKCPDAGRPLSIPRLDPGPHGAGLGNVIRTEEADERRARAIIEQYEDKAFSYCDAVSFAVMKWLDLRGAIALDDHFRQYGQFTIL